MKLCIVISQLRWEIIFTGLSVSAITCQSAFMLITSTAHQNSTPTTTTFCSLHLMCSCNLQTENYKK